MIDDSTQKTRYVILGTYQRATYIGQLDRIEDGRVYLTNAMLLPWQFSFEAMLDMAELGPPKQKALAWPKRKGSIALFRPEEMIFCTDDAAAKWAGMSWLAENPYKVANPIAVKAIDDYDPYCTLGT